MSAYYDSGSGYAGNIVVPSAAAALTYAQEVLADSPLGYWKFNEGSGTSVTDYGSANKTITLFNTPTMSNNGPMTGEKCLTLASASSQYGTASSADFQTGDTFSFEYWIKRSATQSAYQFIMARGIAAGDLCFLVDNTNHLQAQTRPGNNFVVSSATLTDTASWHHVVITKSGSTRVLYVDGASAAFTGSDTTVADGAATTWYFGQLNSGSYFDGSLAHMAYYTTALSGARVAAHYAARA